MSRIRKDHFQLRREIIETDMEMSSIALQTGFNTSLIKYADFSFVKLSNGHFPIIGKNNFISTTKGKAGTKSLSWKPTDAEVAQSGELGYSWGNWSLQLKDTVLFGNYVSIWKKSADGRWLLLLDGGNSTPSPEIKN